MKTLSDNFDARSLAVQLANCEYIGYDMLKGKTRIINPKKISKSVEDNELLNKIFKSGYIYRMSPNEIWQNFRSEHIFIYTTDGKIMNLWGFDIIDDGEIVLYSEYWNDSNELLSAEVTLPEDEKLNVFYSDFQPLDGNADEGLQEIDDDLKWLTE